MAEIFVSYRREDWPFTARLCERLAAAFGSGSIFRDTERLQAGALFLEAIEQQLLGCRVVLVVVSDRLLPSDGGAPDDAARDVMRQEIRWALERKPPIKVVPVIIEGTSLPDPRRLPPDVAPLFARHAEIISDRHFDADVRDLIRALTSYGVGEVGRASAWTAAGSVAAVSLVTLAYSHNALGYLIFACEALLACTLMIPMAMGRRWRLL